MSDGVVPLLDQFMKAQDAIKRVRELHEPDDNGDCDHCSTEWPKEWPCDTIRALDGHGSY